MADPNFGPMDATRRRRLKTDRRDARGLTASPSPRLDAANGPGSPRALASASDHAPAASLIVPPRDILRASRARESRTLGSVRANAEWLSYSTTTDGGPEDGRGALGPAADFRHSFGQGRRPPLLVGRSRRDVSPPEISRAGMAELGDAPDSKSGAAEAAWGFDSPSRHQFHAHLPPPVGRRLGRAGPRVCYGVCYLAG